MTSKELEHKLDRLADAVEKISIPIPAIPAIPAIPPLPQYTGDHDLLTKLDQKVDSIQNDVTALKQATSIYVTQTEHIDLIRRVDAVEKTTVKLDTSRNTQTVLLTIGSGLIALLTSIILWHILGSKI